MPTATPPTITPPRPRASQGAVRDRAATAPSQSVAFAQFVDSNRHLFVDYVQRRLDGRHSCAAEDALQEGLIKIWNEWEHWPADETERIRFARQALRLAAFDAIRRHTGRDDSPRAGEINVDFTVLNYANLDSPAAEGLIQDLGRAIAEQSMVKDQLVYLERASLIAAIATLTDLEQRVLFMTARGDDCKEIAADLGVTHQQTREALMRARRLCRMLIEHADGQKVSDKEAKMLWQYSDGQLSGKRARELKRHVDHCTACQRLLGLEESIATNGALVVLPIPVLLLAAGKTLTAATTTVGASSGSGAAASGSVATQLGGSLLAPAAPATTFGSVLAGITAKVALGLAGLATTASIAGVYKLAHDRQSSTHRPLSAQVAARTTPPHDAILTRRASAPAASPRRHKAAVKHAPKKRVRRSAPATRPASTPAATPARTPPAVHTTAAPVAPPGASAAATNQQSSPSGGEFVLGSR